MRCYGSSRASAASTTVRGPMLAAASGRPLWVVEVGVFNTTTTGFVAELQRVSALGTATGSVTEQAEDPDITPVGTVTTGHSADATLTGGPYERASIPAAIGGAMIWTFGGRGLKIPAGTATGMLITCPTGTGQVFDFYFVWEE